MTCPGRLKPPRSPVDTTACAPYDDNGGGGSSTGRTPQVVTLVPGRPAASAEPTRPPLPDRPVFENRLAAAIRRQHGSDWHVAVAAIRLDGLRLINEVHGYAVGDGALIEFARRLRASVRQKDCAAHFVGNEFVLLTDGPAALECLSTIRDRMLTQLATPTVIDGRPVDLSVSMGIASTVTVPPAGLLEAAHRALATARTYGGGHTEIYDVEAQQQHQRQQDLLGALRGAIGTPQLRLHYQPIVHLATGRVTGAEALARWAHPTLGMLPPGDFITLAEDAGLISDLGGWLLSEACRQAAACVDLGSPDAPFTISVNLSAGQLHAATLVPQVRAALDSASVDPSTLALEVTETAVMGDPDAAISTLEQLRDLGVQLAIDDFGTGYATLTYLRRLPVHVVKVDQSFVHGMLVDSRDAAIVGGTVDLARALDLATVAEGVETAAQAAELRRLGSDYAQGFLWSRAVPAADLHDAVRRCTRIAVPAQPTSGLHAMAATRTANLPGDTLLYRATIDSEAPVAVTAALRALLRVSDLPQVPLVLTAAVRALGGTVVPAAEAGGDALPADLSLGETLPLLAEAPPDSAAHRQLTRWLPQLMEDARIVVDRLREQHRAVADSITDPSPRTRPPATLTQSRRAAR